MPTPEPDELPRLLRAHNAAPDKDDAFFAALATYAASSASKAPARGRTTWAAIARLGAVIASATLIVSGGAMASALLLSGAHDNPPGRQPVEPARVSGTATESSEQSPSSTPGSTVLPGMPEPGQRQATGGDSAEPEVKGPPNGNANGHNVEHEPNINANGHANGPDGGHEPNGNANGHPNGNGLANGHDGEHEPEGKASGQGNGQGVEHRPHDSANANHELPGQGSTAVK